MYLLMFVGVVAVDGRPVPVHIRAAARLLVPSELPHYRRRLSSRSGPDAGAVPSGHAGLHIQPVRLPAGLYGVSSVGHFEGRSAKELMRPLIKIFSCLYNIHYCCGGGG